MDIIYRYDPLAPLTHVSYNTPAQAIQAFAADPALRQRVGEANRAKARGEFDEARMIERYGALYRGLIGAR